MERLALEMEGTVTGEHGVGLKLRDALIDEIGQSAVDMMRTVSSFVNSGRRNGGVLTEYRSSWRSTLSAF